MTNFNSLIGRHQELSELQCAMDSGKSEFVVVYGRRRVGKTFLIRKFFNDQYAFNFTGNRNLNTRMQLTLFANALCEYSNSALPKKLDNWFDAFNALKSYLSSLPEQNRKVVFIDEMPWMETSKSHFVEALEYFWNGWASGRDDIVFIACGSATSWMVDNLLHNQGGLFSRVTRQIYLRPFKLAEMEEYLQSRNINWDRYQIIQCYMIFGGIPFYLSLLNPSKSLLQNIDHLFFSSQNAQMMVEYDELYKALFKKPEKYMMIMDVLCAKREGMNRNEIMKTTGISGAGLTKVLSDLERCDFIFSYIKYGSGKNNQLYRVKDFYTLFYEKFASAWDTKDGNYWSHLQGKPNVNSWQGFSFELVCLLHLDEIKKKLGIHLIQTESSVWRSKDRQHPLQIDLVIKRTDRIINLCEIKFCNKLYAIDKTYEKHILERQSVFVAETKTKYATSTTFITTYGVLKNQHSGLVNNEVVTDDLFN